MESLLEGCFYKVSYKTAIGRLKASIRTQITTYLCINVYGLTWERILPALGALRDDTRTAARETSIPWISQPHFALKIRIPATNKANPESRDSNKANTESRDSNKANPESWDSNKGNPGPRDSNKANPDPEKPIGNPRYSRTCNAEKLMVSRRSLRTSFPWPFGGVASPSRLASFPPEMESLLAASPRSWGRLSKLPNEGGVLRDSWDHSPFLGTESSFYRRSKINKYTRRLLKTPRWRLDFTLWPYEDYSITHDDSPKMTRWGAITWRELLQEWRWLDEDDSTRVTRRGDDSKRTTRRGSLDEARGFDETTLSHKSGLFVRNICFSSCGDEFIIIFLFQSFEMFSLLLMTFMANPLFLLL